MKKINWNNPLVVIPGYLILTMVVGLLVILLKLPTAFVISLCPPLLWFVFHFDRRIYYPMVAVFLSMCALVIYLNASDIAQSMLTLLIMALALIGIMEILIRWTNKQRASLAELKKANERYRIVADYANNFEAWRRPDGSFAYVSPSAERITGNLPGEFLKNPDLFFNIIHPEDRRRVMEDLETLYRKNAPLMPMEFRIIRQNGEERWLELVSRQVYGDRGEYLGKRASIRDITDRKTAEEALAISNERLKTALEGTEDGVWDLNFVTRQAYFSSDYSKQLGFNTGPILMGLQKLWAIIHPDDLPAVKVTFKEHLEGKTATYKTEYRLKTRGGEWHWVLDRARVIARDEKGNPVRMVGTHVDITDRKKTEEALGQSEERFRQLAENIREVIFLADRSTNKVIYANPAYQQIWGRKVEGLYQDGDITDGIHPDDLPRIAQRQQDFYESGKNFSEEFRVIHPDGSMHWVWMRYYPIYDATGQYYRIAGVAEDITHRRMAEAALQESERRYRDLIEQQGEGVGIINYQDMFIYVNPAGEDIFGLPRGTLIGRNLKEFVGEEQISLVENQAATTRKGIETSYEIQIKRSDGEKRNLLITATPRFDVNGQYLGTIVIFRDFTQRKQTEEKLLYTSTHDALTGLYNRAFFEDEIARAQQSSVYPISIIMIDVDGMKDVNDSLGHYVGDQMLQHVAEVLKLSFRQLDTIARIGGDEFAVVMLSADNKALGQSMSRVQENVDKENDMGANPFTLSLSVGGTTTQNKGTLTEAIKTADAEMYKAKEGKKNRYFFRLPTEKNQADGNTG